MLIREFYVERHDAFGLLADLTIQSHVGNKGWEEA
jgi:hypothetical protein